MKNKSPQLNKLLLSVFCICLWNYLSSQQSYTFTSASATGSAGPTQAMVNTAYLSTNLNGSVTVLGGIQSWTVPATGLYRIDASGASGGNTNSSYNRLGGLGARTIGEYNLTAGSVLRILVGQKGPDGCGTAGGGGGSFIQNNGTIIHAAGGGGGASSDNNAANGTTLTSGTQDNPPVSLGGTGGNGGSTCLSSVNNGGGGGGYLTNGVTATGNPSGGGGLAFLNGGLGGLATAATYIPGGFGGGGGGTNCTVGGGGGGGYSGGAGGQQVGYCQGSVNRSGGGGGGSLNTGANQVNTIGFQSGPGRVIITSLCFISLTSSGSNSLAPVICSGATLTLTTNAATNYTWSTGNTSTTSIIVSPTVTTSYSIIGTSTANCQTSAVINVVVYPTVPSLTVVSTGTTAGGVCPARSVTMTASGAVTYTWTGGVINGASFTPTLGGTFTVTGENACGTSTAATSISIHPIPTVGTVVSTPSICSGSPVSLTGVGNAVTYTWTGGITNGLNFFPSTTGSYTVTGTNALSCTNSAVSTVTVVTTPQAQPFASPPLICIGNSSTLTAAGATTYTWTSPLGVFNTTSLVVTPTITTTYTVDKANANCVNTQTVNVIVNQLPNIFAIVTPTLICASKPATLTAAGAASYTWMAAGPPAFTVTGANPIVSPPVSTMYTVTASDGTCVNTTTVFLAADPNPTLSVVPSSSAICRGETATLTASGALTFTWTTPTGTVAAATIIQSPTNSVLYTVIGTNTFNCNSPASQVIVVNPTPTLNLYSNKPLVCIGAPASLTVSGANTYQWDANANNATTPVTQVNPLVSTVYSVTGFYTATGCNTTKTIQVNVFSPTFAVNNPTSSCLGGTINLIATGAISYTWNGSQPFQIISVSPPEATVYVVAATSQSNGVSCVSTNSVGVAIYVNPTVTAAAEPTLICKGEVGNLLGFGASTYMWNTSQAGSVIPVSPAGLTVYTVTGTDQNGCLGTATVQLRVSTCFGISEKTASEWGLSIYPNPNSGSFIISSQADLQLSIVNELGQLVRTIELSPLNEHKLQITDLANGIYFIKGENSEGKINEKIVIMR